LESALKQGKAGVGSSDSALTQELQNRRAEVLLREKVLDELQRGLLRPDGGHSARLRLVAQSIPVPAWITEVRADETQLEVRGYTLDPSVLSDWVNKLAASPLMQGQKLSAVKVERASAAVAKTSSGAAVLPSPAASLAVASTSRSVWSFNLLSRVTQSSAQAGSKP
jgi:Tfp pilus assembly protein PilN